MPKPGALSLGSNGRERPEIEGAEIVSLGVLPRRNFFVSFCVSKKFTSLFHLQIIKVMRSKLLLLLFSVVCLCAATSVHAQSYAITNAKIVTVSGATIDKGTIVVRNGLIDAVGAGVVVPADAQVFDATGLTVYPGFFDTVSNLGVPARQAAPGGGGQGGGGGGAAAAAAAAAAQQTSNSNYPAGLRPEESLAEELRAGESQFDAVRNAGFTPCLRPDERASSAANRSSSISPAKRFRGWSSKGPSHSTSRLSPSAADSIPPRYSERFRR
jgi:hypothetical protein